MAAAPLIPDHRDGGPSCDSERLLQLVSKKPRADGSSAGAVAAADFSDQRDVVAALEAAQAEAQNLRMALQTARCVGMAVGIVMARRGITSEQAFDLLAKASHHQHRKVRELAEEVVYTGTIPVTGPSPRPSVGAQPGTSRRF